MPCNPKNIHAIVQINLYKGNVNEKMKTITFLKTLSLLCKKITVHKYCLKFSQIHSDKIYF